MDALDKQRRSPALLAAQQKLINLRKIHRAQRERREPLRETHGRRKTLAPSLHNPINRLPKHLGWGSEPLTVAIRAAEARRNKETEKAGAREDSWLSPAPPALIVGSQTETDPLSSSNDTLRLYPNIAMAMLKQKLVASGRIWLLLHYIDEPGRGWIEIDEAREKLTKKGATHRVCGWRQLRKLLTQGEGLFWHRHKDRIWLRSIAKTAVALGVQRLSGLPVALPAGILLQPIGVLRAHFYASFHSGRQGQGIHGEPKPLARERLRQLGHISRRTQRRYEKRARVHCKNNYAISRHYSLEHHQEQAWKRGRAVFLFTDHLGKLGRKEATYTAWQLPNSYKGPHDRLARGQQKRINRKLGDLFMKGMTGNGKFSDPEKRPHKPGLNRCFFSNGARAGENYNRFPKQDAYWSSNLNRELDCRLWHMLPGRGDE